MTAVSVVIPVFERQAQGIEALRSALAQIGAKDEIVIVDDGSREPFWLPDYAAADPRVTLIRHEINRGAAAARNTGIKAALGTWIAFLDSDDLWLPGKLDVQRALALEASQGQDLWAIATGFRRLDAVNGGRGEDLLPVPASTIRQFASGCWFAPGSTVLLPASAFDRLGGFDTSLGRLEDLDWFLRFGIAGGRLAVAPVIGSVVRVGSRPDPTRVDAARERLADKWINGSGRLPDASDRRRLRAYLDLESASANYYAGKTLRAVVRLGSSLLRVPRLRLPLERWWWSRSSSLPKGPTI
ncbi:MAG: glycosyltransferase [Rhizobiaceae bacterium]|nr:glycosyltransferase [Rhizobiaceae bacterium]